MKCLSISALFLLILVAPVNTSIAQTTPVDNQTTAQSKQDAKAAKAKPTAKKATSKTPKSGASKKSTNGEDAAYASAYKAGAVGDNKGTSPK